MCDKIELFDEKSTKNFENYLFSKGISSLLLMMRAGLSVYKLSKKFKKKKIFVLVGPGNNGGDALAFAFYAYMQEEDIQVYSLSKNKGNSYKINMLLKNLNLTTISKLPKFSDFNEDYLIIDGLLGIGLSREPKDKLLKAIKWINKVKENGAKVISIDLPSGLNINNGVASKSTVNADATIMTLVAKQGCYTGEGMEYSGICYFDKLGISTRAKGTSILLNNLKISGVRTDRFGYKGKFGKILILGGWNGMSGAANLAGLSALRAGIGKAYVCSNDINHINDEIIKIDNNFDEFKKIINIVNVVVAGPGLGINAYELLAEVWKKNITLILDADALIWLSENFKKKRRAKLICTPHYGEARRLLGKSFRDRFKAIRSLRAKYGGNWILKGPGTLILANRLYINNFADNILSSAGTGDILAGILGGLVGQNIKNPEIKAVMLHTKCALKLKEKQNKTLIASDLVAQISRML